VTATGEVSIGDTPVWLLDVDGVINAAKSGWGCSPRRGEAIAAGGSWPIRWSPQLIQRLRVLYQDAQVEICWCTSWCADADGLEQLFGLPRLRRAWDEQLFGQELADAKLAAARQVLDDGRRLIWTDDQIGEIDADGEIAEAAQDGRALLITPNARRGLRPEHIATIERFLDTTDRNRAGRAWRDGCAGKRTYETYTDADRAARRTADDRDGHRFCAYRCRICSKFHVGNEKSRKERDRLDGRGRRRMLPPPPKGVKFDQLPPDIRRKLNNLAAKAKPS
jgi:hypothetical protein